MTLAQELGLSDKVNNVSARPRKGYFTQEDEEYVTRKVCCSSCNATLAALVHRVGHDADLIWPYRVDCIGDGSHRLMPRAKGEDANATVEAKVVTRSKAAEFLKSFA